MRLRARIVLPVSRPPISDGAVLISGGRIVAVCRWRDLSGQSEEVVDLGDSILLPGLINAHCHLDYTAMAGQFPSQRLFTDWIKLITTTKAQWSYSEFAESWLLGARMLLQNGTTTVGDIETAPELLPEVWDATPLRVISFMEMTGVKSRRRPKTILQEALSTIDALPNPAGRVGLSPHAPYSTVPELIRLAAIAARRRKMPLAIHVAESAQEFAMFMQAEGEMFSWIRRNERDMSDCGNGSPVEHLQRCQALRANLLAIHANYLGPEDADLLARGKVNVVHCPRSHAYFRHQDFPYETLTRAGVNICLGTDSLASVYQPRRQTVELDLFEEMRRFALCHPNVSPSTILGMVTVNASRALGLKKQAGRIAPSAWADLVALPYSGKMAGAYDAVLQHHGHVGASMINGQWALAPGG